jgi:hypothetical protein
MKKCINDPDSYYIGTEPSPKGLGFCAHAEIKNKLRIGKDGKMWSIITTDNNIKKWIKTKGFFTHNNGGKTYFVHIKKDNTVIIHKVDENNNYDKIIKKYTVKKVIVGKFNNLKYYDGNTILLKITDDKYVYIGNKIYEFKMLDEFKKYYSLVGNSDVSYPVLVGSEYVYFMLDSDYISKDLVKVNNNNYEDAYSNYYKELMKKCNKMKNIKIIDK